MGGGDESDGQIESRSENVLPKTKELEPTSGPREGENLNSNSVNKHYVPLISGDQQVS